MKGKSSKDMTQLFGHHVVANKNKTFMGQTVTFGTCIVSTIEMGTDCLYDRLLVTKCMKFDELFCVCQ